MINIRPAIDKDIEAVLDVERKAFGSEEEAQLTKNLLEDITAQPLISLLAFEDKIPVGHILLTKACLEEANVMILAPLAVIPEFQKKGIGTALIREALKIAKSMNIGLVFVLGYPEYYPKHGFKPAGQYGLKTPYPIEAKNEDAWMVIELLPDLIGKIKGKVLPAEALRHEKFWRE